MSVQNKENVTKVFASTDRGTTLGLGEGGEGGLAITGMQAWL